MELPERIKEVSGYIKNDKVFLIRSRITWNLKSMKESTDLKKTYASTFFDNNFTKKIRSESKLASKSTVVYTA